MWKYNTTRILTPGTSWTDNEGVQHPANWTKWSDETKTRNRRPIFRFLQGVVLGSFVTAIVFYSLTYKEHERITKINKKDTTIKLHPDDLKIKTNDFEIMNYYQLNEFILTFTFPQRSFVCPELF